MHISHYNQFLHQQSLQKSEFGDKTRIRIFRLFNSKNSGKGYKENLLLFTDLTSTKIHFFNVNILASTVCIYMVLWT